MGRLQVTCEVAVCITVVVVEQLALQPTVTLKNANYNAPPQRGGPGPDSFLIIIIFFFSYFVAQIAKKC